MRRFALSLLTLAASLLLSGRVAQPQTTTGSIVGTITDATGAVVPNASVTVNNVGTGLTLKAVTDASGNYAVTPLPVGSYTVVVEAPGFKKSVNSGITLNVQDRIGVNVVLELGQVTETVEITGAARFSRRTLLIWARLSKARRLSICLSMGDSLRDWQVLTAGTLPTAARRS